jgi:large subunit ribosomal protein L32|tara:strand:- start:1173 stop:1421 length:249 start_codon:yes stop_codon:yes gene_type:complete
MAVPKQKISKSKRGNRRAGNGAKKLTFPNITVDSVTGEDKVAHHVSPSGYYNGKKVVEEKKVKSNESEENKKVENKKVENKK